MYRGGRAACRLCTSMRGGVHRILLSLRRMPAQALFPFVCLYLILPFCAASTYRTRGMDTSREIMILLLRLLIPAAALPWPMVYWGPWAESDAKEALASCGEDSFLHAKAVLILWIAYLAAAMPALLAAADFYSLDAGVLAAVLIPASLILLLFAPLALTLRSVSLTAGLCLIGVFTVLWSVPAV